MAIKRPAKPAAAEHSSLRDKVAVVTGASRGIGLEICKRLGGEGMRVIMLARDRRTLTAAAKRVNGTSFVYPVDVADNAAVATTFADIRKKFRQIDVLINNAGTAGELKTVDALDPKQWDAVITTNLTGMFLCTHYALPMMPNGAAVVNNLSVAAQGDFPGMADYNASKWGALGFTNTLRVELRERGIRVVALLPGATDTDIWNRFWPQAPREKMLTPETVAQAVVDLLKLPASAAVEELRIAHTAGSL
jgi:NAD(P)-dependent dehydrogenase (short-subunit alcohol dehydrogenase family)